MTSQHADGEGASVAVSVEHAEPVSSYVVAVDGERVGRADFIDSPTAQGERIFFHTEVDPQFGGRGLAGLMLRDALADSIRDGLTVVPVCPLFARHLNKHGDEFLAEGGAFRTPTRADVALIARIAR